MIAILAACGNDGSPSDPGKDPVVEVPVTWATLAAGGGNYWNRTCGLTTSGAAYCWSWDFAPVGPTVPTAVHETLRFSSLWLGWRHTCGIAPTGETHCWPVLGPPAVVSGGRRFESVVDGDFLGACGLDVDGGVYCWAGLNYWFSGSPHSDGGPLVWESVSGGMRLVALAGDGLFCGITDAALTYCWNSDPDPTPVVGSPEFTQVDAYQGLHSLGCGLTREGEAYCWGRVPSFPPDGRPFAGELPQLVRSDMRFDRIEVGDGFACGLTEAGAAYCWGRNQAGQLGNGTRANSAAATAVAGGFTFRTIAVGEEHACGVTEDGAAYCWGSNAMGELGNGQVRFQEPEFSTVPVAVRHPRRED